MNVCCNAILGAITRYADESTSRLWMCVHHSETGRRWWISPPTLWVASIKQTAAQCTLNDTSTQKALRCYAFKIDVCFLPCLLLGLKSQQVWPPQCVNLYATYWAEFEHHDTVDVATRVTLLQVIRCIGQKHWGERMLTIEWRICLQKSVGRVDAPRSSSNDRNLQHAALERSDGDNERADTQITCRLPLSYIKEVCSRC